MTGPRQRRAGMVRSHAAIDGGDVPSRSALDEATLLIADPHRPCAGLGAHAQRTMALCRPGVLSVAEVAYHLRLPGAVVKAIVARLVDSGHLGARAPYVPAAGQYDLEFLQQVLDALHKL
ncbi:DUF742 domain-containing protein [Actinomadura sp. ATCC 31491]|uniref:DUF742 domain-containing protein n=1 Tax=Actinomadura luzonensis TaxID=2805427 RepID=A0ABT0FVE7_9ACTN|nr:DUF742 domain-containing protein [Actinomadura luzonensis]MCK2216287.1 DUF742 domain-containing protein [Actinomadura luzonensis]